MRWLTILLIPLVFLLILIIGIGASKYRTVAVVAPNAPAATPQVTTTPAPAPVVPAPVARVEIPSPPAVVEPPAQPPRLSATPKATETHSSRLNLSFKDWIALALLVLGLALMLTGRTKTGVLLSAAATLMFITVPATTTPEEARDFLRSIPFSEYWSTVKQWMADLGFSVEGITSYVSSLDTTAKVLFGAVGLVAVLLGLGAGVKSVVAVGGLAALFLVLNSVSWSDVKNQVTKWESAPQQKVASVSNPLPTHCSEKDVGIVSLTDKKWALPQRCAVHITIYQGALRMQDNKGNTLDADADTPWEWPYWFEPTLVWSKTPTAQAQFVFQPK